MIDFVATLITVAIFISPVIVIAGVTVLIVKKLNKRKIEKLMQTKPKTKLESYYVWIMGGQESADRFENAYKKFYDENDEYFLSDKELKEGYDYGDKVYKFEPYELPLKMVNWDVYSYIEEGEWEKIGRIKSTADIDGKLKLFIFPNIYKYVTENHVEKESDDSYFGIEVSRYVNVE